MYSHWATNRWSRWWRAKRDAVYELRVRLARQWDWVGRCWLVRTTRVWCSCRSVRHSNVAHVGRRRRLHCGTARARLRRRRRRLCGRQWRGGGWRAGARNVVVEQLLDAVLARAQTRLHTTIHHSHVHAPGDNTTIRCHLLQLHILTHLFHSITSLFTDFLLSCGPTF